MTARLYSAEQIEARSARNRKAWDKPLGRTAHSSVEAEWADRQVAKPPRKHSQQAPAKPSGRFRGRSSPDYEEMLARQLIAASWAGLKISYIRQYAFAKGRKYRADFFFPSHGIIVEVEGQAHSIKGRWKDGILRDQVIFGLGYRLLKVGTWQVRSGEAVTLVQRALK